MAKKIELEGTNQIWLPPIQQLKTSASKENMQLDKEEIALAHFTSTPSVALKKRVLSIPKNSIASSLQAVSRCGEPTLTTITPVLEAETPSPKPQALN